MSQDNLQKMKCSACSNTTYWTNKNKRLHKDKLEMQKFCKHCRKHTKHVEGKKK